MQLQWPSVCQPHKKRPLVPDTYMYDLNVKHYLLALYLKVAISRFACIIDLHVVRQVGKLTHTVPAVINTSRIVHCLNSVENQEMTMEDLLRYEG